MAKPESRLQRRIRQQLKKAVGGYWRKVWGGPYQAVFLDIVGCVDGLYIELEVKVPGKEHNTSDLQDLAIEEIKKAGGITGVVSSPEQAIKLVRKAQARAKGLRGLRDPSGKRSTLLRAADGQNLCVPVRPREAKVAKSTHRRSPHGRRHGLAPRT
jgi:hypothetical protein